MAGRGKAYSKRKPRLRRLVKPHYIFRPTQILRRIRYSRHGRKGADVEEIILPWGVKLSFRPASVSGSAIARTGVYDLCLTEAIYRLAEPGEFAVDIGANIGYVTSVMATRVGRTGKVLAVEPNPNTLPLLFSNTARWAEESATGSVTVCGLAFSDQTGTVQLHVPEEGEWASLVQPEGDEESEVFVLDVASRQMDDVIDEDVGVVKLDAEEAELKVLRGARRLLREHQIRDVVFEEHQRYPTPVTDVLEGYGYSVFRLDQTLLGPRAVSPMTAPIPSWDPPSYLATIEPSRAVTLLHRRGWAVLGIGGLPDKTSARREPGRALRR